MTPTKKPTQTLTPTLTKTRTITRTPSKTATPTKVCYTLTLASDLLSRGTAQIITPPNCNGTGYLPNTDVDILATPISSSYVFAEWVDASGRGTDFTNRITVKMVSNLTRSPRFVKPASTDMNVYVFAYYPNTPDNLMFVQRRIANLSEQISNALTLGTASHYYNNSQSDPALRWNTVKIVWLGNQTPVHCIHQDQTDLAPELVRAECLDTDPNKDGNQGIKANYATIFDDIDSKLGAGTICNLINAGDAQEVWIWADGLGYMAERVAVGPLPDGYMEPAYDPASPNHEYPLKDCTPSDTNSITDNQYAIMGFNYERALPDALESYGHRLEDAFDVLFPCEFDVPKLKSNGDNYWSLSSAGKQNNCGSPRGYVSRILDETATNAVAQCGWAHYSPNVTLNDEINDPTLEYRGSSLLGDLYMFKSGCADWNPDTAVSQTISPLIDCTSILAWRCGSGNGDLDKTNFHIWWMQNLPARNNDLHRCSHPELALPDWWAALRGEVKIPKAQRAALNCNPNPPLTVTLSGVVQPGAMNGATITLYTLEAGGALSPVLFDTPIVTAADGSYTTPALPSDLDGKTIVIRATGGSFTDPTSGKLTSFEKHTLYAAIPALDFNRPLGGVVTPFTDVAFHLTQQALKTNPDLSPAARVESNNTWIAASFGLGELEGGYPVNITEMRPADIFGLQPFSLNARGIERPGTAYALALNGLLQQAADAGVSPVEWLAQFSADAADDGILNGTSLIISQSLPAARTKFMLNFLSTNK